MGAAYVILLGIFKLVVREACDKDWGLFQVGGKDGKMLFASDYFCFENRSVPGLLGTIPLAVSGHNWRVLAIAQAFIVDGSSFATPKLACALRSLKLTIIDSNLHLKTAKSSIVKAVLLVQRLY